MLSFPPMLLGLTLPSTLDLMAYLPLPSSPTDAITTAFFLGLVGIIAWNVYTTGSK